jgi:glycerophosphoryl diester phosphodiesterase
VPASYAHAKSQIKQDKARGATPTNIGEPTSNEVMFKNEIWHYSPKIIAHRGGKNNFPENTIYAFENALKAGSDGLEVDVQLSKDGIVVLYHPHDLGAGTNGKGEVSAYNYNELKQFDAAYYFDPLGNKSFPERGKGHFIPTLTQLLKQFPDLEIVIDLKSLPAKPLIDAIMLVADEQKAWDRLIFYSTNEEHINYLKQIKPQAKFFETRNQTRQRLLTSRNEGVCCCENKSSQYIGFELSREMVVEESFKLGKDTNKINFKLWDDQVLACIKQATNLDVKIFLFGINNIQDYQEASKLKVDAVFSDNPVDIIKSIKQ